MIIISVCHPRMCSNFTIVIRTLRTVYALLQNVYNVCTDSLALLPRYKHTGDAVTTVTAAFDRITINHALTEICDLELSGMVTHTGRSSMEISLQVAKAPAEGESVKPEDVMITCQCTMVCFNLCSCDAPLKTRASFALASLIC